MFSQQWNPSKYVFAEKKKIGLSYTPYLSKLVNDIFLANITYSLKKNDRSAWGFSLKYFSLGDIQFNDLIGNTIVQQGIERPNELTLDASYGLKLNQSFSMAVAARYIRSDLKLSSDADPTLLVLLELIFLVFITEKPSNLRKELRDFDMDLIYQILDPD